MYRDHLHRMIGHLKQALRMEQRLTLEESYQVLELSEAITDYGQMIQAHYQICVPQVIVEIPELASRFRETPQTIEDALRLLGGLGRAEPVHQGGLWKLQLASALPGGRKASHSARGHSGNLDDDNQDIGAA